MAKDSAWGLTSGLPEGEFWIDDAEFGYREEVQSGQQLLLILSGNVKTDEGDVDEHEVRLSVGSGWDRTPGGKEAFKEGKEDAQFNMNSAYGRWIAAAVEAGAEKVLRERGTQREAKVWIGLGFRIENKTESFKDRETGERREFNRVIPVEYLGEKGGKSSSSTEKAGKEKAGKESPKESPAERAARLKAEKVKAKEEKKEEKGDDEGLEAQLTALAKEHDTHDAFLAAAYELDGVEGSEWDGDELLDEDKFYAQARK